MATAPWSTAYNVRDQLNQRGPQQGIANMLAGVQQNRQQLQQPDAEQRGFQQALQLLNAQQEGQANLQQRGLQAQAQMNADAIQGRLRQQALDNQGSLDQIMARGPYDMFGDLAGQLSNPWQYDTAAMLEKGRQGRFDSLLPLLQGLYGGGASGGRLPRVTGFKADNINQYGMLPNF